ncbi:MAG TPA: hypothetical protein DCS43_16155 [Verrucomicrobia bacterium]|nr:hypothetical protein [Verrucomicrobiota bacterium]
MHRLGLALATSVLVLLPSACRPRTPVLTVFNAAVFEPVLHDLRAAGETGMGLQIRSEAGGSGNIIRRVAELGRQCDLMLLADPVLFKTLGGGRFTWRIDFASDEMALAVGIRAPFTDLAGNDWPAALLNPQTRLARADEKISPVGARTLTVWSRREAQGFPGLRNRLLEHTGLVTDDAGSLAARLRAGDADYAFLYRSSCLLHELRHIRLAPGLRLAADGGTPDPDAISYALSIPQAAAHQNEAEAFIRFILDPATTLWADKGFLTHKPRFFGSQADYARFRDIADYGGEF